jgi:hypothetical protein
MTGMFFIASLHHFVVGLSIYLHTFSVKNIVLVYVKVVSGNMYLTMSALFHLVNYILGFE